MSEKNIQLVRSFFEAVPQGDAAGARAVLDPNVEWIEPEVPGLWFGGIHRGADNALREVVEPTLDLIDDFYIRIDEYLDAGDEIVALGSFHGVAKATGMELDIRACFVCTVRKGKIVRFRAYHNTAQWLAMMGEPVPVA
jgi:uncharacterized protein